jgi:hypothetical protein
VLEVKALTQQEDFFFFCSVVESEGKHIRLQEHFVVSLQEHLLFVGITRELAHVPAIGKKGLCWRMA